MRYRFGLMIASLWWGSLTALGFIVVPMLFTHLPSPAAAGQMAAKLFTAQTWLSVACCMFLLLIYNQKDPAAHDKRAQAAIKFIVTGLLEFGLSPRIVSARLDGGNLKLLHGLGSAMYFGQWLCAGFALWRLTGPAKQ
jgi:Domain of unknown function (DUF4149)